MDVEIRKNRARQPKRRPPSRDFLKTSRNTIMDLDEIQIETDTVVTRRLSLEKIDINPSLKRVESLAPKIEGNTKPSWLIELRKRKKKEEIKPTKMESKGNDDNSTNSVSDYKNRPTKPTLEDLQKGAEKINNSLAELQKDIQVLLTQIKQMQITNNNVNQ